MRWRVGFVKTGEAERKPMENAKLSRERSAGGEIPLAERERIRGILESVWAVRGEELFPEVHFFRAGEIPERLPGEIDRNTHCSYRAEGPIAQFASTRLADGALRQHLFVNVDNYGSETRMDSTREEPEGRLRKLAVYQTVRYFGLISPALSEKGRVQYRKIVEAWINRLQTRHPWHYKKLITPRHAYGYGLNPSTPEGREQIVQQYCERLCLETVLQPAVRGTIDEIARLLSEDIPGANWNYEAIEFVLRLAVKITVSRQED